MSHQFLFALFSTIMLLFVMPANAISLNDTGITQCGDYAYGGSGIHENNYDCSLEETEDINLDPIPAGQDGHYGRDVTDKDDGDGHAGFSFTKLGVDGQPLTIQDGIWDPDGSEIAGTKWTCVLDKVTDLMWEVKTDDGGFQDNDWSYTWYNSDPNTNGGVAGTERSCSWSGYCDTEKYTSEINSTGLCGYSDWRLPNRNELRSIVDYSVSSPGPAVDIDYFPNTMTSAYWSSTSYSNHTNTVLAFFFHAGSDTTRNKGGLNKHHIRLVRGDLPTSDIPISAVGEQHCRIDIPVSTPTDRFTDNNDGTVTDNYTNLMWKKCIERMSGENCTGWGSYMNWKTALDYADGHLFAEYNDWRLPNVKEITSIIEDSCFNPMINLEVFPRSPPSSFWSSSPSANNADRAWKPNFNYGNINTSYKHYTLPVRLVRDITPSTDAILTINIPLNEDGDGALGEVAVGVGANEYICNQSFCDYTIQKGTEISLTAIPTSADIFHCWNDMTTECHEDNPWMFTLDDDKVVTAGFGAYFPVIIVPGIFGSWSTEMFCNDTYSVQQVENSLNLYGGVDNFKMPQEWMLDPIKNTYSALRNYLEEHEYTVVDFAYDWRKPINTLAFDLRNKIIEVKELYSVPRVHIVAHSMGGLITRDYIQNMYQDNIDKFIMIGTPNTGSVDAYWTWERGNFSNLNASSFFKEVIVQNMKVGCDQWPISDSLFIRYNIPSVKQLLPTFDYAYYPGLLEGEYYLAEVESMCHFNDYLLELNENASSLVNKNIKIKIFASSDKKTLESISMNDEQNINGCAKQNWADGKPSRKNPNDGDKTVLFKSAYPVETIPAFTDSSITLAEDIHGNHSKLPREKKVLNGIIQFLEN